MTTWKKMVDITKATLAAFAESPKRVWTTDQLREQVSTAVQQPISEFEIRDAIMRIAARSIVTYDSEGTIRVDRPKLHEYKQQLVAAE